MRREQRDGLPRRHSVATPADDADANITVVPRRVHRDRRPPAEGAVVRIPASSSSAAHREASREASRAFLGDAARKIVVSRVMVSRDLSIPDTAKIYNFITTAGVKTCWRPTSMSADVFVQSLADCKLRFNRRSEIKLYFPVYKSYFVVKSFSSGSSIGFTVKRLMRLFENLAEVAMAHYLRSTSGLKDIRLGDVHRLLRAYAVCSLRVQGNRIYAFTRDARHVSQEVAAV